MKYRRPHNLLLHETDAVAFRRDVRTSIDGSLAESKKSLQFEKALRRESGVKRRRNSASAEAARRGQRRRREKAEAK